MKFLYQIQILVLLVNIFGFCQTSELIRQVIIARQSTVVYHRAGIGNCGEIYVTGGGDKPCRVILYVEEKDQDGKNVMKSLETYDVYIKLGSEKEHTWQRLTSERWMDPNNIKNIQQELFRGSAFTIKCVCNNMLQDITHTYFNRITQVSICPKDSNHVYEYIYYNQSNECGLLLNFGGDVKELVLYLPIIDEYARMAVHFDIYDIYIKTEGSKEWSLMSATGFTPLPTAYFDKSNNGAICLESRRYVKIAPEVGTAKDILEIAICEEPNNHILQPLYQYIGNCGRIRKFKGTQTVQIEIYIVDNAQLVQQILQDRSAYGYYFKLNDKEEWFQITELGNMHLCSENFTIVGKSVVSMPFQESGDAKSAPGQSKDFTAMIKNLAFYKAKGELTVASTFRDGYIINDVMKPNREMVLVLANNSKNLEEVQDPTQFDVYIQIRGDSMHWFKINGREKTMSFTLSDDSTLTVIIFKFTDVHKFRIETEE